MAGKDDISVFKLINYNLTLFIPLLVLYIIAHYFSGVISAKLDVSAAVTTQILMLFLSLVTFFILIPFLRIRESIKGVRFSLFNFVVMGFLITIPSLLKGNYGILMSALLYLANFIFATFINCPDVIGISGDPEDWFKHKVQIMIFVIYVSIISLYILGFGWLYYQMAIDPDYPNAFSYQSVERPSYFTFAYFSIISMATVGYGDITPVSAGARFVMSLQIMIGMVINVIFIAILLMYVTYSRSVIETRMERKIEREERDIEREERKLESEERKIEREEDKLEQLEGSRSNRYPNYLDGRNNR